MCAPFLDAHTLSLGALSTARHTDAHTHTALVIVQYLLFALHERHMVIVHRRPGGM